MSNIVPVDPSPSAPVEQVELPKDGGDNFIAEAETMDLTFLRDKMYVVAVNTGARDKIKLLASTLHGPYTFPEMVEQVGTMWRKHLHHAKVLVLTKDPEQPAMMLSENTVDYIEAKYDDIIVEAMFTDDGTKDYTCEAAVIDMSTQEDDPRKVEEKRKQEEQALLDAKKQDEEEEL